MSIEIVNQFTSSKNIKYLYDYLNKNLSDTDAKIYILENLSESVFSFPSYALLEENTNRLRHSTDVWTEVRKLNQEFIDNRKSFFNEYEHVGIESYHFQSFIDDSLKPKGYEHLNDPYIEDNDRRIFRYQDKHDSNKSSIPQWQILNKSHVDKMSVDELRDSEYSQNRKSIDSIDVNHVESVDLLCKKPQWMDI